MRKLDSRKCIFLLLLVLSLIIFSFKDSVYSKTSTTGIPLEPNPKGVAINPENNIAVIAIDKKEDWYRRFDSDYVSVVDLYTQTVISKIPVGRGPRYVAIDRGLNIALVSNNRENSISVIDLDNFSNIKTIPVGRKPQGIAIHQLTHIALVANCEDDTVSVIDLTTYKVTGTIQVSKEPKDIAIDPGLNLTLVTHERRLQHKKYHEGYYVTVIDLTTSQVIRTVPVGRRPKAIDINPETHLAAVVNERDNSMTVIHLDTWETATIPIGKHPIDVAINPLDNCALVICDGDRNLLLIDLDTKKIIENYSLNKKSRGVAVNNFTNRAAVVDDKTDSLIIIQLPNPVPEVTSISLGNVRRGSSDITVNIIGNKFINSSIAYFNNQPLTTTFIDNHRIHAIIPQSMLSKAGIFSIAVANPPPKGGVSNGITFIVNNPAPAITAIEPAEAMAGTSGLTLNIYGTGFFENSGVSFGGVRKPVTYISNTKLQIGLTSEDLKTAGQHEIAAFNPPPGGGNSNTFFFTIKVPLEIHISYPSDGSTINKAKTIVKGTIKAETADVGVTVNGILAEIRGNEWIANNIPLMAGTNTITAVATDAYGNTDTKVITVHTVDTTQSVELLANITSGVKPLSVSFSASTSNFSPVSYQMDYEGDGISDYTGSTFDDISHTYTSEGVFYPTLTVTDYQGNTYTDSIAVTVFSKTEIDTLLKEKWEGMKEALFNKDITNGLNYFLESSREVYQQAFDIIVDELPLIISNMQNIEMIYLIENIAKYRINRVHDIDGNLQTITYYIYFVRDKNGIWKIDRF